MCWLLFEDCDVYVMFLSLDLSWHLLVTSCFYEDFFLGLYYSWWWENAFKSVRNTDKWRKMEHLSSRSICSAVRLMELLSTKCIASKRSPTSTPIARAAWDRGGGGGWWRTYEGSLVATSGARSTKKWQGVKRWAGLLLLFTCTFCQIQIFSPLPSSL